MSKFTCKLVAVVSAVALTTLAFAGCTPSGGGEASTSGPIKIGGSLALTGSLATVGQEYEAVYKLWEDGVNAKGGLLGRSVQLDIKNDNSSAQTAQTEYQTLITRDRVDLLLAPYATFVGAPIVPLAVSANKVLFNGGFIGKELSVKANGWMVTSYPFQDNTITQGFFEAVQELPSGQRPKRVGILTNNNPFTLVARDGFQGEGGAVKYAKDAGMEVVYSETYSGDTSDFTAAINGAKAANVDLMLALSLPNDAANILKTSDVLGFQPDLMCACGSQVSTLRSWAELGKPTNTVVSNTSAWPTQKFEGMAEVEAFAKSRGYEHIPSNMLVAYASLQVLQQAVEGANSLDQNVLKDYLHANTFKTAVGDLKFGADGTPPYSVVVTQTESGRTAPVWPSSVASAKLTPRVS